MTTAWQVERGAFARALGAIVAPMAQALRNRRHLINATAIAYAAVLLSLGAAQAQTATATTLTSSPTSSVFGQSVSFTATITAASGTTSPTGTVTFSDGITTIGSATANASGSGQSTATLTTSALPVGNLTITASYSGDSTFNPSAGTTPFTVQKQGAGTSIASSVGDHATLGQSVTFTAVVIPFIAGTGPPTGTVNGTPVATPTLDNNGQATFTTSSGPDTVVATYNGDDNFAGGTGGGFTVTVSAAGTSPPSISKQFGAASINVAQSTSLRFTINNPNASSSLTGVSFTDTLPSGLVVATPNGLSGTCNGTSPTAMAGSSSVSLSGATLAANNSCTFSVNVTATSAGAQNNITGPITSTELETVAEYPFRCRHGLVRSPCEWRLWDGQWSLSRHTLARARRPDRNLSVAKLGV